MRTAVCREGRERDCKHTCMDGLGRERVPRYAHARLSSALELVLRAVLLCLFGGSSSSRGASGSCVCGVHACITRPIRGSTADAKAYARLEPTSLLTKTASQRKYRLCSTKKDLAINQLSEGYRPAAPR